MFGIKKNNNYKTMSTISILDKDSSFSGTINSISSVELSGKFEGDLISNKFTIKEGGAFKGNAKCLESVFINNGKFEGELISKNIKLEKGAKVFGDLFYCNLEVEQNAEIHGNLKRITDEEFKAKIEVFFKKQTDKKDSKEELIKTDLHQKDQHNKKIEKDLKVK